MLSGKTRIHLNVERWRVCEAWFSPTMAGIDSAGLGEVLLGLDALAVPDCVDARYELGERLLGGLERRAKAA